MVDWTLLRTKFGRKESAKRFEALALKYVKALYPELTWTPTPPSGDGNRDGYAAVDGEYEIWEEAKYRNGIKKASDKKDRALERKDVDSAVLSGLIYGKVRLIIFVTNAPLPSEVMMRSMLGARIRGIEVSCVLAPQLEKWLSQNKKIYRAIFGEPFPKRKLDKPQTSFMQAQIYDPLSTDFSPLQKRKSFYVGERAILELVVYSDEPIRARLKPLDYPFDVIEDPAYASWAAVNLPAGMSGLTFMVQMKTAGTRTISVCLELNGVDYYLSTVRTTILPSPKVLLSYTKQLYVIMQLRSLLQEAQKYEQGKIVTIYAGSSMGKSFALRAILEEFCIQHDITLITFDSSKSSLSNYVLLCKMVLFLCYGNIFWDIVSATSAKIESFKAQVLAADQGELFAPKTLSALLDGCFDANIAANTIQTLLKQSKKGNTVLVHGRRTKAPRILLLDDVQYLSGNQMAFFQLLYNQLADNSNSNIIVAAATKGNFSDSKTEAFFCGLTPNRFDLNGLSLKDKSEVLHRQFNLPLDAAEKIADRILPDSPLLAKEVLRTIGSYLDKVTSADAVLLSYTSHINDTTILQDKFSKFCKQFYLLDIIYKFKKGIPLKAIESYSAFDRKQVRQDIKLLASVDLISVQDRVARPYHDYYVMAYQRLRGNREYGSALGGVLEHLLAQTHLEGELDFNQVLAMLLYCGKRYAKAYRARVKDYILKYIHETQFGAALQFCEYYYAQIAPIEKNRNISHEDWYFLYLHADCLVHCDNQKRAAQLLDQIYQQAPDNSVQKYEAGASLLNQNYWAIRPLKVISDSVLIQTAVEQIQMHKLNEEDMRRMRKAYDSCFNRRMAAYLLLDQERKAREIYLGRLKMILAGTPRCFKSNAATLIMDYARGISYQNPAEAHRLMNLALSYFKTNPDQHYRRLQLCIADAAVLASIAEGRYESKRFSLAKQELWAGGFLSEYFKAVVKDSVCKLIEFSTLIGDEGFCADTQIISDVETAMQNALIETRLLPQQRELVLWNYLRAFISACRGDYSIAREYISASIEVMKHAGASYLVALRHNYDHIETVRNIAWCTHQSAMDPGAFLVDCRLW